MKVIFKDYKAGELKVQVTSRDDLWSLSQIIEAGDIASGKSLRKVKLSGSEAKESVVKKPVFLAIEVEKVEFHPYAAQLRVSGIVREGPEDVPNGSHHAFEVEDGTIIRIAKKHWYKYQIDRVNEAVNEKSAGVLICILDRGEAGFALLKNYGYDWLSEFEGNVGKKGIDDKKESTFYDDAVRQIEEYAERHKADNIILASPAFWKEELFKVLQKKNPSLAKKAVLATCNATGKEGVNEVLKRDEVRTVLMRQRVAKEMKAVEELLAEISRNNLAVYGMKDVKSAAEAGAVKMLLVADLLIQKMRQEGKFGELDYVMRLADKAKGGVVIISSEHEGGKKLNGLGGIGALLRYRLNY